MHANSRFKFQGSLSTTPSRMAISGWPATCQAWKFDLRSQRVIGLRWFPLPKQSLENPTFPPLVVPDAVGRRPTLPYLVVTDTATYTSRRRTKTRRLSHHHRVINPSLAGPQPPFRACQVHRVACNGVNFCSNPNLSNSLAAIAEECHEHHCDHTYHSPLFVRPEPRSDPYVLKRHGSHTMSSVFRFPCWAGWVSLIVFVRWRPRTTTPRYAPANRRPSRLLRS
ncbi:hypothetical protein BR93DRAFT_255621 [Coniochaeta sp. PMI_546]|nr:hypothetical protein BR93DRAFT_255621 [Coniochaeta sp. PMI_546]